MSKILIIDDEPSIRNALREILEYEKYIVDEAKNGEEGLELLSKEKFDIALCDIKMPKMDGITFLSTAKNKGIETEFIIISAHGSIDMAVEATKIGAFDFIQKPPDLNKLLITVRNAIDKSSLLQETKILKKKISSKSIIIGKTKAIKNVIETINKVAITDARVLITGENGTGKELVARQLYEKSTRCKKPYIEVNCASIPSELIESELFGHEKGAFTSAQKQRIGKFESANGGTLFLDEIGDMSISAQAKVLRALQENKICRVGGNKEISIDVRVLAATNKNLKKEINNKKFREDLYHRLAVILIKIPPLRERKEDISLLVEKFLTDISNDYGSKRKTIDSEAIQLLMDKNWTGNIRELRNVIERLVILGSDIINKNDVRKYTN